MRLFWCFFLVLGCCEAQDCAATTFYAFIAKAEPLPSIWNQYFSGKKELDFEGPLRH